jgi:hypothetical protein
VAISPADARGSQSMHIVAGALKMLEQFGAEQVNYGINYLSNYIIFIEFKRKVFKFYPK